MAADLLIPELKVEAEEGDYIRIVGEPLEAGFGTTLGNALRRVLLSSLPGAAVTSVRIEGVDHEFSSLEHMKEDVTEFLLNLKEVRLRALSDRPARLYLEASGAGEVTAGQIQATADCEIVNPELHLATLDHDDASVVVDINVETGRGYLPATVGEGLPIGVIAVDAVFTPVRRVNYRVSHTRVGQDTNFDRLDLEVWTDGTVDGETATSMAAEIVRDQLMPFFRLGRPEAREVEEVAAAQQPVDGHDTPIETLGLSVRAYNCLKRSGLTTVGLVLERSEEELLALRNFGEKSYEELREKLVAQGFPPPRTDTRFPAAAAAVAAPQEPPARSVEDAALSGADEQEEGVGALGRALMEALKLKEAGEDPS